MTTVARYQRGIWTYIRSEATDGPPPTPKEGETWYDPGVCVARQYNGTAWEYFHFSQDFSQLGIAGYDVGGITTGGSYNTTTVIHKILFSTEALSTLATGLTHAVGSNRGVSSTLAGYSMAGAPAISSAGVSRIGKMSFATEGTSSLTSTCVVLGAAKATFYSASYGYAVGGAPVWGVGTGGDSSKTDKLAFSTDTVSSAGDYTSASGTWGGIGGMSPTIGYSFGRRQANTIYNANDKMPFSSETWSSVTSGLTTGMISQASAESADYCYIYGGADMSQLYSTIHRMVFTTEAIASLSTNLGTGAANSFTPRSRLYGTLLGYGDIYGNTYSFNKKFLFSTEAMANLASTLSTPTAYGASVENLN